MLASSCTTLMKGQSLFQEYRMSSIQHCHLNFHLFIYCLLNFQFYSIVYDLVFNFPSRFITWCLFQLAVITSIKTQTPALSQSAQVVKLFQLGLVQSVEVHSYNHTTARILKFTYLCILHMNHRWLLWAMSMLCVNKYPLFILLLSRHDVEFTSHLWQK